MIDEVIREPMGAAHRHRDACIQAVGDAIERHLDELAALDADALRAQRYERFRALGKFVERA